MIYCDRGKPDVQGRDLFGAKHGRDHSMRAIEGYAAHYGVRRAYWGAEAFGAPIAASGSGEPPPMAEWMHRLHPMRLQYESMSDANPFAAMLAPLAGWMREHRKPVSADNPFLGVRR